MGLYINELCYRLLGPSSSQTLFSAYQECLVSLSSERDASEALRAFEHALLQELGVFPEVSVDSLTNPIDPHSWYRFNQNNQFERVADEQKNTFLGSVLLGLGEYRYHASVNPLFHYLVDLALDGRQLESRRLYESLFTKQTESR
jgi:DNA repair protein RecO (recombination protein O)